MFGDDPRDLCAALSQMEQIARQRSNFNQLEAKQQFKTFLHNDRRFDLYDADKLVDRVMLCKSNGAVLDLDDPQLRGLPPRPLDRSGW